MTLLFLACSKPEYGVNKINYLRKFIDEKKLLPNPINYGAMIQAYGRNNCLKEAFEVADEYFATGLKPKRFIFKNLLSACNSAKIGGFKYALLVSKNRVYC